LEVHSFFNWPRVVVHQGLDLGVFAEGFEAAVNEDADVAFLFLGDAADFEVAEAVGPEVEGFALVGGECFDEGGEEVVELGLFGGVGGVGFASVGIGRVRHRRGTPRRAFPTVSVGAEEVEGAVAADGVEPGGETVVEVGGGLVTEAEEDELDHVAGFVEAAEQALGIAQQPGLELVECGQDPLATPSTIGEGAEGVGSRLRERLSHMDKSFSQTTPDPFRVVYQRTQLGVIPLPLPV
jgi:hypothetical protein